MRIAHTPFRRTILTAAAIVIGGVAAVVPSTAANATEVSYKHSTATYNTLTFYVHNDTSEPLTDWRIDFDLPQDTYPGYWFPVFYWLTTTPTETGYHVTIEGGDAAPQSWTILPNNTFQVGIFMNGQSPPTNCVVDLTDPCTMVTS